MFKLAVGLSFDTTDCTIFKKTYETIVKKFGAKHFIYSKQRFILCRQRLETMSFIPIQIDLKDTKRVAKLFDFLQQHAFKVSYLNLTNVMDYIGSKPLLSCLKKLPLLPNAAIVSTSSSNKSHKHHFNLTNKLELLENICRHRYGNKDVKLLFWHQTPKHHDKVTALPPCSLLHSSL